MKHTPIDLAPLVENIDFVCDVCTFNQEVLGIQQRKPQMLVETEYEMTLRCLREELVEYQEAHQAGDLVGSIDALTDLAYFLYGAMYKHGLTPSQIKQIGYAVHTANMTKKKGVNAKRDVGAADAVKHAGWVGPEAKIAAILDIDAK